MTRATRPRALLFLLAGVTACGDSAGRSPDGAAVTEAGICGTTAQPGRLTLAGLAPAIGATMANQSMVHGFTVVVAPAEFNNFDLRFGPLHTAGQPTPENPKFSMTPLGSDILYQLTIDAWSTAPGHVELLASGGFQTKQGCAWAFPSPLFSYDLVAGPDGGMAREAGSAGDSRPLSIDGNQGVVYRLDAPLKFDLPANAPALDANPRESGAGADAMPTDGATVIDSAAIDASID